MGNVIKLFQNVFELSVYYKIYKTTDLDDLSEWCTYSDGWVTSWAG